MVINESPKALKGNLCERNGEEYKEKRKVHINLMRKLIHRFKDENKDYTEEWEKSELKEFKIDVLRQANYQCLNQESEDIESSHTIQIY